MPRKESITRQAIFDAAFAMLREEGIENVTARKLAAKIGCSTQPIFRVYKNMDELQAAAYEQAAVFLATYCNEYGEKAKEPFVNLGMAYISFAAAEKNLFRLLFLSKQTYAKSMYELLNGERGAVSNELQKATVLGCKDPGELFTKMWIFIHGAASMTLTGDYDLGEEETCKLLIKSYQAFSNC
ncbi:MAG: WHG domain-containing protein [Lachnospiraceae bacterium]|nr:WHG domain-containing protein [Lachnospiraceae bacterium]